MLTRTNGIILRLVKHSDKASVVTIYTHEHGRISLMVYGISAKKSSGKAAILLPLSLVEINADIHPGKDIGQLKEAGISIPLMSIRTNPLKNAITLFMAELLLKTLNHPEPEESLYDFLVESILTLEKIEIGIANFHLSFMIKLSIILGFEPNQEEENPQYFDLMNGMFTFEKPAHNHFIDQEISGILTKLINAAYNQLDEIKMTRYQRSELLNQLIDYYKLHVSGFHGLKSPDVLHEIFN